MWDLPLLDLLPLCSHIVRLTPLAQCRTETASRQQESGVSPVDGVSSLASHGPSSCLSCAAPSLPSPTSHPHLEAAARRVGGLAAASAALPLLDSDAVSSETCASKQWARCLHGRGHLVSEDEQPIPSSATGRVGPAVSQPSTITPPNPSRTLMIDRVRRGGGALQYAWLCGTGQRRRHTALGGMGGRRA